DIQTGQNNSINMTSWATTEQSIKNFVYDKSISSDDTLSRSAKEDRYRERLNRFIKNLYQNDIIDEEYALALAESNIAKGKVFDNITEVADSLQTYEFEFKSVLDQPSLKYNHEIQTISQDVNKLLYE